MPGAFDALFSGAAEPEARAEAIDDVARRLATVLCAPFPCLPSQTRRRVCRRARRLRGLPLMERDGEGRAGEGCNAIRRWHRSRPRTHPRPAQRDAGLPSDGATQACARVRHRRGRASGKGASDENSFTRLPAWLWMPGQGHAGADRADMRDRGRRAPVQALELRMDALERQASACQPPQSLWWNANNQGAVLLVLDRAADLTSPMLHEYSYQVDLRLVSVFGIPAQLQVRPESSCS